MVETITSVTIENWAMMNCKMSLKDGKEIDIDYIPVYSYWYC